MDGGGEINELRFGFRHGWGKGCSASPTPGTSAGTALQYILIMDRENQKGEKALTSTGNQSIEPFHQEKKKKRCTLKEDSRFTGFWDLRQISTCAQRKVITVPLTCRK